MKRILLSSVIGLFAHTLLAQTVEIQIDSSVEYQTIEGFGASDAWSTEIVGRLFPEARKENAAKWLFCSSLTNKEEAQGIGLSIWRFCLGPFQNMPAGSSFIPQDYLDEYGNYEWTVNPGKQWFLDKALSYGCDQIGAWSACIPKQLRTTGINAESFQKYGAFLADIIAHYNELGYRFKYIAPVNEPQYDWTNGEVKWTSTNIAQMTRTVSAALIEKGVDTPLFLGEAADWGNLYDTNESVSNWARKQLYNFFDPLSINYIGNLPNLKKEFGAHSYWTDQTSARLIDFRTKAKSSADQYGISLHQTEWSLLSDPPIEGLPDTPTDMDLAMILGKVIHSDLYYAGVNSWTYWEAFGVGGDARFHLINTNNTDQSFKARKNLWVLGNYSLFIRPGYKRIAQQGAADLNGLMGTSYLSPDGSEIISVFVNMGTARTIQPVLSALDNMKVGKVTKYVTSSVFDLQIIPVPNVASIAIPARSVTTLIHSLEMPNSITDQPLSSPKVLQLERYIQILSPDVEQLTLLSISGQPLFQWSGQAEIMIPPRFPAGFYLLKIVEEGRICTEQIVLK